MIVTVLKLATSTPCITVSSITREMYKQVQRAVVIEYFQASEERVWSQNFSVFEAPRYHGAVC